MTRPYDEITPRCLPDNYIPSPAAERILDEVDLICSHQHGGLSNAGLRSSQVIGLIIALDRRGLIVEPDGLTDVEFDQWL